MARFGNQHPAKTLLVAGVKFMGETAKILTPEKTVIMPTLEATCSLDLGCPPQSSLHSVISILTVWSWFMPIPLQQ